LTGAGRAYPEEYVEMKFCERFRISPLEYAQLPRKKIKLWLQMIEVEQNVVDMKSKREAGKKKLFKDSFISK
jgi:hypothetical protein